MTTKLPKTMEPLVKCSTCESLVNLKHLSSHDCPLTQSVKYSLFVRNNHPFFTPILIISLLYYNLKESIFSSVTLRR
jgi:hypothetical protein